MSINGNIYLLCEVVDGPEYSIPIERDRFTEQADALAALHAKADEYAQQGYLVGWPGKQVFTACGYEPYRYAEWSCGEAGPSYAFVDDGKKTPFDDDAEWVAIDPFAEEVTA